MKLSCHQCGRVFTGVDGREAWHCPYCGAVVTPTPRERNKIVLAGWILIPLVFVIALGLTVWGLLKDTGPAALPAKGGLTVSPSSPTSSELPVDRQALSAFLLKNPQIFLSFTKDTRTYYDMARIAMSMILLEEPENATRNDIDYFMDIPAYLVESRIETFFGYRPTQLDRDSVTVDDRYHMHSYAGCYSDGNYFMMWTGSLSGLPASIVIDSVSPTNAEDEYRVYASVAYYAENYPIGTNQSHISLETISVEYVVRTSSSAPYGFYLLGQTVME